MTDSTTLLTLGKLPEKGAFVNNRIDKKTAVGEIVK